MTDTRETPTDPAPPPDEIDEHTPRTRLALLRLAIAKVEVVRSQLDRQTDKLDRLGEAMGMLTRILERVESNQALEREQIQSIQQRLTRVENRLDSHLGVHHDAE